MTWLTLLLLFKIGFTIVTAVGPMLLMPGGRTAALFGLGADAVPLVRLYGMALLALVVGYAGGIPASEQGQFPVGVVLMGIVSNLGASVLLVVTGAWRKSPLAVPAYGSIALGLMAAWWMPATFLGRAW